MGLYVFRCVASATRFFNSNRKKVLQVALYRCAACGSPNVVTDIQKEGYDYVKGAIGTVVLGAGGAVAGLDFMVWEEQ